MSLQASMWTGVSGLLSHGEKMNVVGNNIANVSTIGFKGQRMDFADFVYGNVFTSSGISQVGRGVKLGAVMGNFTQGPFETTTEATDLAISGMGFFKVGKIGSDQAFYTRAGNFRFNSDGYLIDPNGLALQGWRINNDGGVRQAAGGLNLDAVSTAKENAIKGTGAPTDIRLDTWTVLPQQTTNATFKVNLPNDGTDKSTSQTNPFFSLLEAWNGTQPPASPTTLPMPSTACDYQSTMDVYDEAGTKHKLTVYFDRVSQDSYANSETSYHVWEYVVTMDPAEDLRQFMDTSGNLTRVNTTEMGGMLMSGTMTFASNGSMTNQTAYTWGGSMTPEAYPGSFSDYQDPTDPLNTLSVINLDPTNLNNWYPASISTNGLPMLMANFSGVLDAQTCGSTNGYKYNMELDFGLKVSNYTMPWENQESIASMTVPAYIANTSYKADGSNGPEYILLNSTYNPNPDPATSLWDDPNKLRYVLDGLATVSDANGNRGYGAGVDGTLAGYHEKLMELTGTDSITIPANTEFDTLDASGFVFALTPANIATAAGTPPTAVLVDPTTLNYVDAGGVAGTLNAGDPGYPEAMAYLKNYVEPKLAAGTVVKHSALEQASATDVNHLAEITKPVVIDSYTCTSNGGSFSNTMAQNGYGFGDLTSYYVDQEGVMFGVYSNGVTLPLWQVTLYDFVCRQGLRREGNNLFSQTRDSGEAKSGPAGAAGLGTISGSTIEQSNVDMATEFVQMISTQRGFQANSKVVTTTDVMLETVIQMKR